MQVLVAIVLGFLVGWLAPDIAESPWMKALGDGFIKLIKMAIAPIIFCTVVSGIAHIEDASKVGRVGVKALIYFEIVSTLALAIGLLVGNFARPGDGFSGAAGDPAAVAQYADRAAHQSTVEFILHIIPDSLVGAFADGNILQVLLIAILFGFALMVLGERGRAVRTLVDDLGHAFFGIIAVIMKAAPIGAFGAMAYTIGKYGPEALGNLAGLIATFYVTSALFIFLVLGTIAWVAGFSIFRFLGYIKDELLLVLGTSSSESALPQLMEKLERLGCSKSVVGLVVPTGYSFNLDGTNIYLTLATLFIAQAMGVELTLYEQLVILGVAMLTSKGASGVTGAGFVTLAATLAVVQPVARARHGHRARHRQVHERVPGADQLHRQRRRHHRRVGVGGRARSRQAGARACPAASIPPTSRPPSPRASVSHCHPRACPEDPGVSELRFRQIVQRPARNQLGASVELGPRDKPEDDSAVTSSVVVVGEGDELVVLLGAALEAEEVVVAAAAPARERAAHGGPRLVDGAGALGDVEEAADLAEHRVLLAPHGVLAAMLFLGKRLLGVLVGQVVVAGQALHIALIQGDERVRAAITGAFLTLILRWAHARRLSCGVSATLWPRA